MNCIISFKSHFKLNIMRKRSKKIFLKNILINLFFLKVLLINCNVKLHFSKKKTNIMNILRAPSRHKKFTHQYTFEFFLVKLLLTFPTFLVSNQPNFDIICLFISIKKFSKKFTSSLLVQTKIQIIFNIPITLFLNRVLL